MLRRRASTPSSALQYNMSANGDGNDSELARCADSHETVEKQRTSSFIVPLPVRTVILPATIPTMNALVPAPVDDESDEFYVGGLVELQDQHVAVVSAATGSEDDFASSPTATDTGTGNSAAASLRIAIPNPPSFPVVDVFARNIQWLDTVFPEAEGRGLLYSLAHGFFEPLGMQSLLFVICTSLCQCATLFRIVLHVYSPPISDEWVSAIAITSYSTCIGAMCFYAHCFCNLDWAIVRVVLSSSLEFWFFYAQAIIFIFCVVYVFASDPVVVIGFVLLFFWVTISFLFDAWPLVLRQSVVSKIAFVGSASACLVYYVIFSSPNVANSASLQVYQFTIRLFPFCADRLLAFILFYCKCVFSVFVRPQNMLHLSAGYSIIDSSAEESEEAAEGIKTE